MLCLIRVISRFTYIQRQKEKGPTEDDMVGWYHQLNGLEFEQAPGDGEGQGSLECCNPWGLKESDKTEQLNNNCLILLSFPQMPHATVVKTIKYWI